MTKIMLPDILRNVTDNPDSPSLVRDGRTTSFGELGERTGGIVDVLSEAPPGPVLVTGHKEPDAVAAMLACMFAGRAFSFADRSCPPRRVERIARLSGAGTVLGAGETPCPEGLRGIRLQDVSGRPLREDDLKPVPVADILYVIFTSGSTGEPKGVPISRANFGAFDGWYRPLFAGLPATGDAHVNHASLSFDMGMLDLWPVLALGLPVIMLDHGNNIRPRANLRDLVASPQVVARSWFSTPSFLHLMCTDKEFCERTLPGLSVFFIGGENVSRSLVAEVRHRFPDAQIRHAYGPSEGTCLSHVHVLSEEDLAGDGPLPLGEVVPPTKMRIIDPTGRDVAEGDAGEVELSGPQTVSGYLPSDHPGNVAFSFRGGERVYRTGDLGRLDGQGRLLLLGRVDRQVKWNGNRIELDEIERTAASLDGVEQASCIALREGANVTGIVLFVKRLPGTLLLQETLAAEMAKLLPSVMIPKDIRFVDGFPVTPNGKLDAKALLESARMSEKGPVPA